MLSPTTKPATASPPPEGAVVPAAPATLEYGRRPRRRVRAVVGLVLLVAFATAVYRFGRPLRDRATDAYADWRYARTFDRAVAEMTGPDDLWLAPPGLADPTANAHLRALLAPSDPRVAGYHQKDANLVVFARAGRTGGRQWLAFACASRVRLEVFTFERGDRAATAYDRLLQTLPFAPDRPFDVTVREVRDVGDEAQVISSTLMFAGSPNEIVWSVQPMAMPTVRNRMAYSSPLVAITATPSDGWTSTSGGDWWPDTGGWTLIDGRGPDRDIPARGDAHALTFAPDGRLAMAAPGWLTLLSTDGSRPTAMHPLPATRRPPETWVFSGDGARLFVAAADEKAWLVDVVSDLPGVHVREMSDDNPRRPQAAFAGDGSLLVLDDLRLRVDWASGQAERVNLIGTGTVNGFGAARSLAALSAFSGKVNLMDLNTNEVVSRFPQIQGLHQLSISPDGRWLAMKGSGLRFHDVTTGAIVWDHDRNHDLQTARAHIKWTPDGGRGAAAGNRYVYVWSMDEPRWVARFPHGRSGSSPDIAISPDGRRMAASASGSPAVAYWPDVDAATRPAAAQPAPPRQPNP